MEIPDNEDLISEELLAQYRKEDIAHSAKVSIETKALGAATLLCMFLLFLIVVSWDHFHKDIRALYLRVPTIAKDEDKDNESEGQKSYAQLPTYTFERPGKKDKPE